MWEDVIVIPYIKDSNMEILQILGGVFSVFGFGYGIACLIGKLNKTKVKQPSVITEFVKAKYNKYCPKIDWE